MEEGVKGSIKKLISDVIGSSKKKNAKKKKPAVRGRRKYFALAFVVGEHNKS